MPVHESSVNFKNLIKDLADIYPYDVDEVILVELIANALDAKANNVSIDFDSENKVLVVSDDGGGMNSDTFEEYHDFAAGLKTRGTGIGFAGVGAKISFNIANRVVTETFSESFRGGSNWYLKSNKKLIWENIEPKNLTSHGTMVEIHFSKNAKLSFSSNNDIKNIIMKHYLPLIDSTYLEIYDKLNLYSKNLRFIVNEEIIEPIKIEDCYDLDNVRKFVPKKAGKRIGYGIFGLSAKEYPISKDTIGILLCSYGKVIKADLFNQFPGNIGSRIFGIVEVPEFIHFLTTSKTDFIRNIRHRRFEILYSPVREEFKNWLEDLGIQSAEVVGDNEAVKLERELKKLLDNIPELSDFFGFRTKKNVLKPDSGGLINASTQEGIDITFPDGEGQKGKIGITDTGENPGQAFIEDKKNGSERAKPISRVSRQGPKIAFVNAENRKDLAWVDGNNISINCSHPSYIKVSSNPTSKRIHNLFAIASAIQRFIASGENDNEKLLFIDKMMAAWGDNK
jgi:hypothetical protein